jgi:hemerythrin
LKTRVYPKLLEHRQKHETCTKQVQDLEAKLFAEASVLTIEVMDFLKHWLEEHILAEDTRYGAYLPTH